MSISINLSSMRIGSGSTEPGNTDWKPYDPTSTIPGRGIYVDVDTSKAGFTKPPNYVISLCGYTDHWVLTGTSAIYSPSPTSFRVYLRYSYNKPGQEAPPLTPAYANQCKWYVTWIGIEP
jgi:hypothetical protein